MSYLYFVILGLDSPMKTGLPHARKASVHIFRKKPNRDESKRTMILMTFGQFLDHDITMTPSSQGNT